jgi:CDP-6-deoxy-D-xylo-4-hexulose-3-dehydrase
LKIGDYVAVPAIAWPTTVWPIIQLGLVPIFFDVSETSFAIDIDAILNYKDPSGKKIDAAFVIHPLGYPIPRQELQKLSQAGILLLEDTCESLGAKSLGQLAGTTGIAGTFSFYFSHHMTTMEGGGIATNDDGLYSDLRCIRSHGWSRESLFLHPGNVAKDPKFNFVSSGFNLRPMEIQSAIGLSQLSRLESNLRKRINLAELISSNLNGTTFKVIGNEGRFSSQSLAERHTWMFIPIMIENPRQLGQIRDYLMAKNIETRPALTGNFVNQPASRFFPDATNTKDFFPIASKIEESVFLVGCSPDFSSSQIGHLVQTLVAASKL